MGGMITRRSIRVGKSVDGHSEILMEGQLVLYEAGEGVNHIHALAVVTADESTTIQIKEIFEIGTQNTAKVGDIHYASPRELRFTMIDRERKPKEG